jgi:dephospho-CoA kinase
MSSNLNQIPWRASYDSSILVLGRMIPLNTMITVGITGGIGSGKSLVCDIFKSLSIPVFHSDSEAKGSYSDQPVREAVIDLFGLEVYQGTQLNKEFLSDIVFKDKDKLLELNGIIHPAVARRFAAWKAQQSAPYVLKEAAILFESGAYMSCDKVIVVSAPKELRIERVMARDGVMREEVQLRINNQWPEDRKVALADFVLKNDGRESLIPQVMKIHEGIISQAD